MGKIFGIFGVDLYSVEDNAPMTEFIASLPDQSCNNLYDRVENSNTIKITLVGASGSTKSNKEYYEEIIEYLKAMQIESISTIRDRYKILVDFILTDGTGRVIDEGVRMHRLSSTDVGIINKLNTDDELTYRRAKKFKMTMPFRYAAQTPFGIKLEKQSNAFFFKINKIQVMADVFTQDLSSDAFRANLHSPLLDKTLSRKSLTYKTLSENMQEIYNSSYNSVQFNTIKMTRFPREIVIDLELLLNNFFEINDSYLIEEILTNNKNDDTPPVKPPIDPDNPGGSGSDSGFECHCDHEVYGEWKRWEPNDGPKYLVVSEGTPDEQLDETCMVKVDDPQLRKDIPDIKIGEYVSYKEYINW